MTDSTTPNAEPPIRDDRGRFLPGHKPLPGCGRPRGFDFRKIVSEAEGELTPEEAIRLCYGKLIELARAGDTTAIKLLLDRLCDKDPDKLEIGRSLEEILSDSWRPEGEQPS